MRTPCTHTALSMDTAIAKVFTAHCLQRLPTVPPVILSRYSALLAHLETSQERLWHNGNSGRLAQQIRCYYELVASRFGNDEAPTVCETGFNVGHSAITFMSALPASASYFGFDLGQLRGLTRDAVGLLNTSFFPSRVRVAFGKSKRTLPAFVEEQPTLRCDVISIDGDHSDEGMAADWGSLKQLAHSRSLIFTDECAAWRIRSLPGWRHLTSFFLPAFPFLSPTNRDSRLCVRSIQAMLDGHARSPKYASGVYVDRSVHPLFQDHDDLKLVGCARLAGRGDVWADEGALAARGEPLPHHLVGHPERRHPKRPGGYFNHSAPVRPLPASGGLCVARYVEPREQLAR